MAAAIIGRVSSIEYLSILSRLFWPVLKPLAFGIIIVVVVAVIVAVVAGNCGRFLLDGAASEKKVAQGGPC